MKTENTAARVAQTENGGENALNAKPLFGLAKTSSTAETLCDIGFKIYE
ncbi:MAG: hypothetical protein LBQ28_06305 [Prevotellaceae bacterium]|jgi:hypothetical protein|nr:hypothetical protein [Prevotellaceae bacterium]